MKQTAVEFLVKELSEILGPLETQPMQNLLMVDAIKKAKEMEKQQIIDAVDSANKKWRSSHAEFILNGQQYYNETFKNK